MNAARPYQGQQALIVGLGKSGVSTARYLAAQGARLCLTDSRAESPGHAEVRALVPDGDFRFGGFDAPRPYTQFAFAAVSPGVSLDEPFVRGLREAQVEILGDVELFARALEQNTAAQVVAITGSNGKSTVTTLVGEMAQAAGWAVRVGGNLGEPALDLLDADTRLYVLELSSFQLETTSSLAAAAATVLNLSADHLDRHGSMENYAAAKARIYRRARCAIVNRDDAASLAGAEAAGRSISFGLDAPAAGAYGLLGVDGETWLAYGETALLPLSALRIQGLHNAANALAALALAEAVGVPREACLQALRSFKGLPHRCEWVAEIGGVGYINDSKGTNVGATLAALNGLPAPLVWIGGGQGKGQDFSELRAPLAAKARAAVVFGQDAGAIEQALRGALPLRRVDDLAGAVVAARELAQPGDRVLLSPACASLDQFKNYEARGERFRALVLAETPAHE